MRFCKMFILATLVLFSIAVAAQNDLSVQGQGCSLRTMKGSYGSFAAGTFLAQIPGYPTAPFQVVAVALHVFDGNGKWSITYATSFGGEIIPWGATGLGTYTVTPNCELSVLGSTPNGTLIMFTGTITGLGIYQEAHIIYTDPARVQFGTLRKTPPGGCTLSTLQGTYGVFGQGLATPPSLQLLVPVAHVGTFVADGQGNFSGDETLKVANVKRTDTYTATYSVTADCIVSAEIRTPTEVIHEVGTITGVGPFQETHLIVTDTGWVFADAGKKK